MMKRMALFLVGLACVSCTSTRPLSKSALLDMDPQLKHRSQAELWEYSDLVVLARPTTSRDIGMPHVFKDPHREFVCNCWETEFEIRLVLKGDEDLKQFTLLHYQVPEDGPQPCWLGPQFAHFELPDPNLGAFMIDTRPTYWLYLKKYFTGDYVPATGQSMSGWSVYEVYGHWSRPQWRRTQQPDSSDSPKAADGDPWGTPDP